MVEVLGAGIRSVAPAVLLTTLLAAACGPEAAQQDASFGPPVMFRGDAQHSGVFDGEGPIEPGGLVWRFETDGPVRSSPVVAGGALYVGSTDGNLYALRSETGAELWRRDVGSPVSSSPAVAGGLVLFVSGDGVFHAVNARSGAPEWQFQTGPLHDWAWGMEGWDVYLSSPVVAGEVVVFGSGDGSIYALDLNNGTELWRFATEGRIRATPALADGTVFAGSADGIVYALNLEDGSELWRHETEGVSFDSGAFGFDRKSIIASPAVVDGTVYVGSRDGYMYALDQTTGARKWRVNHEVSWAMSSPSIAGDALIAGTSDGAFVHRVDVTTGEETWRYQAAGYTWSSPALAGSTVYIGDSGGFLRALDAETGTERWSFATGDGVYSSPWVEDGTVYFGDDDGSVYAVGDASPATYRAIYWPESLGQPGAAAPYLPIRVRFEQAGYQVLDAEGLKSFFEERVADGARSVAVFAVDDVPTGVAAQPTDTVLFRRYLEAGGKVVWLGPPPMSFVRNEAGQVTAFDRERSAGLVDVDYTEANFDYYASTPTELGRAWGLEGGWVSSFSVGADQGLQMLAADENGLAGAWVKSFGGPEGSGFVGLGLHSAAPLGVEAAFAAAEYGMGVGIR